MTIKIQAKEMTNKFQPKEMAILFNQKKNYNYMTYGIINSYSLVIYCNI
jgi:hypothetical protein